MQALSMWYIWSPGLDPVESIRVSVCSLFDWSRSVGDLGVAAMRGAMPRAALAVAAGAFYKGGRYPGSQGYSRPLYAL
jgi:hypothetical protein